MNDDDAPLLWTRLARWQEFRGEARANLIRVIGVGVFYAIELATYRGIHLGPLELEATGDKATHDAMTALAVGWCTLALAVHLALASRFFPRWLPFFSTGADIVLLTLMLSQVNGPRSPLVAVFFLVITLATLRFRLRLVWFATAGSVLGYLIILGYVRYYVPSPERIVPRYAQVIFAAALLLCGVIQGQIIRQIRTLAGDFAARLHEEAAR